MLHIMDDVSRMSNLRHRAGLYKTSSSSATSNYITMIRIQKRVRKAWLRIKPSFEQRYHLCKTYDYSYVNTFVETLSAILSVKLERLEEQMQEKGEDLAVEDYLLEKMDIDKNNLIFRETKNKS